MLDRLKGSFATAPVILRGSYRYVVHPITDGIPKVEPAILNGIIDAMARDLPEFDLIVTPEAMGIPLATGLSLRTGKPFSIIRKREYGLPGEVKVEQETGYSSADLFINGPARGDRVLLVDDILSTGGTLRAILKALRGMGVKVVAALIAVEKGDGTVRKGLEDEFGMGIRTLVGIGEFDLPCGTLDSTEMVGAEGGAGPGGNAGTGSANTEEEM